MVNGLELAVEPHVQVDDGDTLEFVELTEVRHLLPLFRGHTLDNINGHGRNIFVGNNLFSASQQQMFDGSIGVVNNNFFDRRVHDDLSSASFDVVLHGSTETVGLVSVQESHLQSIVFVQETVHGCQDNGHGQLIGVDEIQGLGHGNEDLGVDALGHTVLAHEIRNTKLVLGVDERLSLDQHGQKRRGGLDFFSEGQHLLISQDSQTKVKGGRDSGDEIEGGEFTGKLLHGKDHLVNLPLETIVDVEFIEKIHHVGVGTEENVKTGFDPITVLVLPRRDFSSQNVTGFVDDGFVTGIRQVLGASQSRKSSTDDGDLLLLGASIGGACIDLEFAVERARQLIEQAVVIGVLNIGLRVILHYEVRLRGRLGCGRRSGPNRGVRGKAPSLADASRDKGEESTGRPLHFLIYHKLKSYL
mmetsp:Transcript_9779/g.20454  ORF Transcript_9779/g.20454 Transcript_9779/m.20454 type:complete len:415 (+) Transcript_9779:1901-3145(+)